jgi:predicted lipoprotein with Yx(FWY)xxD motif
MKRISRLGKSERRLYILFSTPPALARAHDHKRQEMRTLALGLSVGCALLFSAAAPALGASQPPPGSEEHPGVVALSEGEPGKWMYRRFPSLMPLYTYDDDKPGKSTCGRGCQGVWPPLWATEKDKPMGLWTIITRDDTTLQWAYKNKPVYMRFHDSPELKLGDGEDGKWHLIQP